MIVVICAFLGLLIGSFLNVVIYRLPKILWADFEQECRLHFQLTQPEAALTPDLTPQPLSLMGPRSKCPCCATTIPFWQNIPILSFILLQGRCHSCHHKISWRYPLVELLSALLSGYLAWHFQWGWPLAAMLLFTWLLIPCFFIDLDHQLLPDPLVLALLWLGLLANSFGLFTNSQEAIWAAIAGYLCLFLVYWGFKLLTGKEGLGHGDFKLLAALGAWVGLSKLPLLVLLSGILGLLHALSRKIFSGKSLRQPLPFGPSLILAGIFMLLWGDFIQEVFLNFSFHPQELIVPSAYAQTAQG